MSNATINRETWPRDHSLPAPRTEAEIDYVLDKLRDVWTEFPGMSLTQIVTRIAERDPVHPTRKINYDPSSVSDETWVHNAGVYPYV